MKTEVLTFYRIPTETNEEFNLRVNTAMETSKCDLTIKEGVLNILGGEYDAFLYSGENGEEVKIMVKVEEVY